MIVCNNQWSNEQLRQWTTQTLPRVNEVYQNSSIYRYYIARLTDYPVFLSISWDWVDISIQTGHRLFTPTDALYNQWCQGQLTYPQYRNQYIQQLRIRYRQYKNDWVLFLRLPTLIFAIDNNEYYEHASILADTFVAIQHQAQREAIVCTDNPSQKGS